MSFCEDKSFSVLQETALSVIEPLAKPQAVTTYNADSRGSGKFPFLVQFSVLIRFDLSLKNKTHTNFRLVLEFEFDRSRLLIKLKIWRYVEVIQHPQILVEKSARAT